MMSDELFRPGDLVAYQFAYTNLTTLFLVIESSQHVDEYGNQDLLILIPDPRTGHVERCSLRPNLFSKIICRIEP